ncbi:MAG TPA: glycosyltransferase family 4 protein [Acidimicrobiia bacterium]|nr:glycosyltransferase family 4 protein [Acidimicrobiia bacterium]
MPRPDPPLRVAYLVYRGNPHCGGQGVYTRELARELTALGHTVEVFSGQPYPELADPAQLTRVPSLDLYRPENPFRVPWPWEFKSRIDVAEFAIMCAAGFPEPYTFSHRVRKLLRNRRADFDVVHDNQCLGTGLEKMVDDGWPMLATLHHPVTVDRDLDLERATRAWKRVTLRRWYGFIDMQTRVARRIPRLITVSESSRRDILAQMSVESDRLHVVPVGADPAVFRPRPEVRRVPGRIMTTASADVPMKGLAPLLEAVAKVRTERDDAHLVVIGRSKNKSRIPALIDRLGLAGAVRFVHGVTTDRIVELYAEAEVAAVPSLYEGFSLPAVEAMACGVPIVATTGGALPEVVGRDGETGLLVPPDDVSALAVALGRVLEDAALRARIGAAGRARVLERFTWRNTAEGTVEHYRALLDEHRGAGYR